MKHAFLIGNTGVGKSTLGNILTQEVEVLESLISSKLPFKVGHSYTSCTDSIQKFESEGICFYDTPGFYDSRDLDQRIKNAQNIALGLQKAGENLFIIVIDQPLLKINRGGGVIEAIEDVLNLIGSDQIMDSCLLIITKAKKEVNDQERLKELFEKKHLSKQFIDNLIDKQRVFSIYKFKEGKKIEVHNKKQIIATLRNDLIPIKLNHFRIHLDEKTKSQLIEKIKEDEMIQEKVHQSLGEKLKQCLDNQIRILSDIASIRSLIYEALSIIYQTKNAESLILQYQQLFKLFQIELGESELMKIEEIEQKLKSYRIFEMEVKLQKFSKLQFSIYAKSLGQQTNLKNENGLILTGGIISTSEIQNFIDCSKSKDLQIQVYSNHIVYFDSDIKAPSYTLVIGTKVCLLKKDIKIDLKGEKGQDLPSQIEPLSELGSNGRDGIPGNPGNNGGNFILLGDFLIDEMEKYQIMIDVSGGEGGKGQNGQDGQKGIDGTQGSFDKVNERAEECLIQRKNIDISALKQLITVNGQVEEIYISEGTNPGKGGDGGAAGVGGFGGKRGRVFFNEEEKLETLKKILKVEIINKYGTKGEDGKPGKPGIGGQPGSQVVGIYINELLYSNLRKEGEQKERSESQLKQTSLKNDEESDDFSFQNGGESDDSSFSQGNNKQFVEEKNSQKSYYSLGAICLSKILESSLIPIYSVCSPISAYASSGWIREPEKILTDPGENGSVSSNLNENGIQMIEKSIEFSIQYFLDSFNKYLNQTK